MQVRTGKLAFYEQKYERTVERLQPFKLQLLNMLRQHRGGGHLLDVGCGSGMMSHEIRTLGYAVTGIDISSSAIVKYIKDGHRGVVCDLEAGVPFEDATFDAVWISEVIEHVVDFDNLLAEFNRVLKPGGRLYLSTPNSAFIGYRLLYLLGKTPTELQHPYHVRFYSYDFLERRIAAAGFDVVESLGQNIYLYVPGRAVTVLDQLPDRVRLAVEGAFGLLGVRRVPGLIRGSKLLGYWFGTRWRRLLSNCIILVAVKTAVRQDCGGPGSARPTGSGPSIR